MSTELTVKKFFEQDNVRKKFDEMLGKRAPQFITSVLQIATSNELLSKADPISIYNSAAVAATLDLPLNNSLGFAYIVPYNSKQKDGSYKQVAQFQLGYKGFIQLAQRSGQFLTINAKAVYDGQVEENETFEGYCFKWKNKKSDNVIGYAAYFKLLNGFEKTLYMTVDELKKHGTKFSQTFKKGYGLWKDDFDAMAQKTVLKLLLSKYAPLSIEMQKAVITDQAMINDEFGEDVTYADNEVIMINPADVAETKERERIITHINNSKSLDQVNQVKEFINEEDEELFDLYMNKLKELK